MKWFSPTTYLKPYLKAKRLIQCFFILCIAPAFQTHVFDGHTQLSDSHETCLGIPPQGTLRGSQWLSLSGPESTQHNESRNGTSGDQAWPPGRQHSVFSRITAVAPGTWELGAGIGAKALEYKLLQCFWTTAVKQNAFLTLSFKLQSVFLQSSRNPEIYLPHLTHL